MEVELKEMQEPRTEMASALVVPGSRQIRYQL
jgi:hypothetical protein